MSDDRYARVQSIPDEHRRTIWELICKYEADGSSQRYSRRVARDDDGTPNVYNTLMLLKREIMPPPPDGDWSGL